MNNKLELGVDLIYIFQEPVTREGAILKLVSLLAEKGYVKESYGPAVLAREKVFPTGLPTEPVGIAIPHTDPEHVNRGAMAVGILANPVDFVEMGSDDLPVKVQIISMLAIQEPKEMVNVLRCLAISFQNSEFLAGLREARDKETVVRLFAAAVPEVVTIHSAGSGLSNI